MCSTSPVCGFCSCTGGDGLQSQMVSLHSRSVLSGAGPLESEAVPDITRCHNFSCSENSQVGTQRRIENLGFLDTRSLDVQIQRFQCLKLFTTQRLSYSIIKIHVTHVTCPQKCPKVSKFFLVQKNQKPTVNDLKSKAKFLKIHLQARPQNLVFFFGS